MQLFTGCSLLLDLFLKCFFTLYNAFWKINLPLGGKEPVKVWLYHLMVIWTFYAGRMFEKLGICTQIKFVRFLMNVMPPVKEPKLFITNTKFEHVPVTIYQPKCQLNTGFKKGMLYLHGGSGIYGSSRTYERLCCYLARESDSVVVYVEFRLGPEHQHPAQLSDCLAATLYFMKNAKDYGVDPNCILLAGESSGGTLTAAISRELAKKGNQPKIRAQILIYPFLQWVDLLLPSYLQNSFGPLLTKKRTLTLHLKFLNGQYEDLEDFGRNGHVPEDMKLKFKKWISADLIPKEFKARGYEPPLPAPFSKELYEIAKMNDEMMLSPILDEDGIIKQLPETYILTCEYDVLRDDGLLYKKRLEDNAVPVTWNHLKDGVHGFISFIDIGAFEFSYTKPAVGDIVSFIKGL